MRFADGSKLEPLVLLVTLGCVATAAAQQRVSDTVHNLSAGGPGRVRAQTEQQVCIFCHAPHHTGGLQPLWNHEMSLESYGIYASSTLDAEPGQPTGASKLCLSCHDGTVALGSVLSRDDRIRMMGGDFMPSGLTNLGTDLSDDHPVSFAYTSGLAAGDGQLADPRDLPPEVKLEGSTGQLQCSACHDAHDNTHGSFLVMGNEFSALCTTCHLRNGWGNCSHRTSGAQVSGAEGTDWPYPTVGENACRSCHRPHTAGGHERLLIFEPEEDNCLDCHDGTVAGRNIRGEIDKYSAHDPRRYLGVHDPLETLSGTQDHVECADCHNPHAVSAPAMDPGYKPIGETLALVRGVTVGGTPIDEAQYEYEVCFRCHGDDAVNVPGRIVRLADTDNLRLRFSSGNVTFHPVVTSSPSSDTVSLVPDLPSGSLIRCTDCHNNDATRRSGGTGPDGPHGSMYNFLLERNYTVNDNTAESEFEYALCYKCHRRASILADESFDKHRLHIVEENSPCSACHDPHGVSQTVASGSDHTHLINFDINIVRPEQHSGELNFRDMGRFRGSCTLTCHGENHRNKRYGHGH